MIINKTQIKKIPITNAPKTTSNSKQHFDVWFTEIGHLIFNHDAKIKTASVVLLYSSIMSASEENLFMQE